MSAHSLGHEESHSPIYRPHNCWPSLVGGSGCGWRVRGSCAGTCMKPGLTGHLCLPRGGGGGGVVSRLGVNWTSSTTLEWSRRGWARR